MDSVSVCPRQVRHDNTVTWLAYWKDPVNDSQYKYVWLAANSSFKSDSDLAKYEKARKLKDYIGPIRCLALCPPEPVPGSSISSRSAFAHVLHICRVPDLI